MFFEMSDVHCLRCNVQFSQSDVKFMEVGELPVCDTCLYQMYELEVKYDGSQDLLDFLKTELKECRCLYCYEDRIELEKIRYDAPVDAFVKCRACKKSYEMEVNIEFI